jgi:hypothetical protein
MIDDAYEICRHIKRYQQKNCYAPLRAMVVHWCSEEFLGQLVANDIVKVLPLAEHGPSVAVVLTEKGSRMADAERRRR